MTKITALSAVATIVVAIAAPVFAQDTIGPGYGLKSQPGTKHGSNYRGPHKQSFRGSYNRSSASFYTQPRPIGDMAVCGARPRPIPSSQHIRWIDGRLMRPAFANDLF